MNIGINAFDAGLRILVPGHVNSERTKRRIIPVLNIVWYDMVQVYTKIVRSWPHHTLPYVV